MRHFKMIPVKQIELTYFTAGGYLQKVPAPVAQWIEQWPPEPCAGVRFAPGVQFPRLILMGSPGK